MDNNIIKICKIHGFLSPNEIMEIKRTYTSQKGEKRIFFSYRCKKCNINSIRKYQKRNPKKVKEWDIKRSKQPNRLIYCKIRHIKKFGFTIQQYDELVKNQNGLCAICKKTETSKQNNGKNIRRLAIDHCHKTGKVRALLCSQCNKGIGHFNDSPELMYEAINYLIKYSV